LIKNFNRLIDRKIWWKIEDHLYNEINKTTFVKRDIHNMKYIDSNFSDEVMAGIYSIKYHILIKLQRIIREK
jgi:hypothetical protein